MESSASSVPYRYRTMEGPSLFLDQIGYPGSDVMDILSQDSAQDSGTSHSSHVPGPGGIQQQCVGKPVAVNFSLCPPRMSHRCSVSRAPCSHSANGPLNPTRQMTFSIFILLSSASSLLNLHRCPEPALIKAPRCCHQALVPIDCVRDSQIQLSLSSVLHDGMCIFVIPIL